MIPISRLPVWKCDYMPFLTCGGEIAVLSPVEWTSSSALGMDRELNTFSRHHPLTQLGIPRTSWDGIGPFEIDWQSQWCSVDVSGNDGFFGSASLELLVEWHTQLRRDIDVLAGGAPVANFVQKSSKSSKEFKEIVFKAIKLDLHNQKNVGKTNFLRTDSSKKANFAGKDKTKSCQIHCEQRTRHILFFKPFQRWQWESRYAITQFFKL